MNSLLRALGLDGGSLVDSVSQWTWRITEPIPRALLYAILILGLVLACLNFLPRVRMRTSVRVWTCLLRLAMVGLLLLVLAQVELHLGLKVQEQQRWVALVDDSASMATQDEGNASRFAGARTEVAKLRTTVGDRVEFETRSFSGRALGEQPGKGPTLIQEAVTNSALATAGVHRLVLFTDGRDSEGRDLTRLGRDLKARGIALDVKLYGSTTRPKDSAIFGEPERAVIRLGEELIIRGAITGQMGEASYVVHLKENGKNVKQLEVPAEQARQFTITHKPQKEGSHSYTLQLPVSDTLSLNNSYTFKAHAVKERIKVLMIEGFPRFELKLLKVALEVDPMIELTTISHIPGGGVYVQGRPLHANPEKGIITSQSELFKYDVVVLRDVSRLYFRAGGDTSEARLRHIVEFVTKRGGGLLALGGQDVFRAGGYEDSSLMEVLPFDLSDYFSKVPHFGGKFFVNVPKAAYAHPMLRMYSDTVRSKERLNSLRELDGSNNVGRFRPLATPLLTRFAKVKDARGELVEKEVPLMAYQAVGDGKVVAAATDTFWRWQLQPDFDDPPLQTLLANIVRYIAPPPKSGPGVPALKLLDSSPQVGQQVVLSTTLKDKNYSPIRHADLKVTVLRPDGTQQNIYPRDLPESPGYYEYRVDVEMPGPYEVKAKYAKEEDATSFVVEAAASEYADLSVGRPAMENLAKAAGGRFISSMEPWLEKVDVAPSTRDAVRDLQVWNSPLVLLLFFLLVCVDCYIRKRQGLV